MTRPLLDRQKELPRSIQLLRYNPNRAQFSWKDWDPRDVRRPADLPQYLILGELDLSSFQATVGGWSARWQGAEHDTHFDIAFKTDDGRYEIRQTWRGLDGGFTIHSSRIPLDKIIGHILYLQFPTNWDSAAKEQLEAEYQLTIIEQPKNAAHFCGIPDGSFRTIVFPIAICNLRPIRQLIKEFIAHSPPTYPVTVDAKLLFQALNYVEGKAPEWTRQAAVAFNLSLVESGVAPLGFPVREEAKDGSVAWTLRRTPYFLFIGLPFAGLTDFLERMSTENGPFRATSAPSLRFELRPIVMPAGFEMQTESLTLWDRFGTTRSFLQFAPVERNRAATMVQDIIGSEKNSPALLQLAEDISADVVDTNERIFKSVMGGVAS